MSGDFLSRWSRRKRAAAVAAPTVREGQEPPPEAGDPLPTAEAAASTEDTIRQLPSLEDLTAQSDVTAFLQKGVPETLRNAALRRMWTLDPAIRDYVGDARDYAWDWNVPGGVPGTGPLSVQEASTAVRDMWRNLGGEPGIAPLEGDADDPEPGLVGESVPGAEPTDPAENRDQAATPLIASAALVPARPLKSLQTAEALPQATPPRTLSEPDRGPVRRHGRAKPV